MAINAKFKVYCIFERVLMENHPNEFGDKPWYVTTLSVLQRCGNQRSRKNLVFKKIVSKNSQIPQNSTIEWSKKKFSNQNVECSKSFNSQSYLVKIDFWAPFWNFAYYRGSEASLRKFFDEVTTRSGVGHFLEFGPSSQLDIAYFDKTKWS